MSNVIEFPTEEVLSLNRQKKQIRDQLEANHEPEELITHICQRVETLHKQYHNLGDYQFDLALPEDLTQEEAQAIVSQITEGIAQVNQISAQAWASY